MRATLSPSWVVRGHQTGKGPVRDTLSPSWGVHGHQTGKGPVRATLSPSWGSTNIFLNRSTSPNDITKRVISFNSSSCFVSCHFLQQVMKISQCSFFLMTQEADRSSSEAPGLHTPPLSQQMITSLSPTSGYSLLSQRSACIYQ